jgi:hypothetical protein
MRHEGGIEAHESIAAVEIREAQAMLQHQICHSSSVTARRKDNAYFLNILGEFLVEVRPAEGFS